MERWCQNCYYYDPDLASYESAEKHYGGPHGRCLFARVHGLPEYMTQDVTPYQYRDCQAWTPRMEQGNE